MRMNINASDKTREWVVKKKTIKEEKKGNLTLLCRK